MKWRHVWITTKIALSEMLDQPRIWVACAIPAIMACQVASAWYAVYRDSGYPLQITEPLISWLNSPMTVFVLFGFIFLALCDAPHVTRFDGYVLVRSGRKAWYLGKSFQVLFTCAGILGLSLCAGLLMAVPVGYAENRWSLAAQWLSQPGREAAYTVGLGSPSVNPILFQSSYPWQALGMSCCLYLLYGWFLGMLTMLCNLLLPRWLGICLVSLFHLMSVLAVQMGTALAPFSPVRLLLVQHLALARGWGGGTFTGAVALFLGLIALIGAVGYFVARRVDVERERV